MFRRITSWSTPAAALRRIRGGGRRRLLSSGVDAAAPACERRVCVVGSGPAGFYATKNLLKAAAAAAAAAAADGGGGVVCVDMLDRLPTPFGLVRYGVAPDHPEVKAVQNDFTQVARDEDGGGRVRFLGNVELGKDVSLQELREMYDAVVLAMGAEGDREMGIPGEAELEGVMSARQFVNWYNGHPEFVDMSEPVSRALRHVTEDGEEGRVVVIGMGNVALDCARILAKPVHELETTDIAGYATEALAQVTIPEVLCCARRGHAQGMFTIKELRELTRLTDTRCYIDPDDLVRGSTEASLEEIEGQRAKTRLNDLIHKIARGEVGIPDGGDAAVRNQTTLRFLLRPVRLEPHPDDPRRVGSIVLERTALEGEPGKQVAVPTGEEITVRTSCVLRAIGYKILPSPGVPYDSDTARVPSEQGRVLDSPGGSPLPGVYVTGWQRRGPTGVILSNIVDAKQTVSAVLEDLAAVKPNPAHAGPAPLPQLLAERGVRTVGWDGHEAINAAETEAGERIGKPRAKIVSIDDMLRIAGH